MQQRGRVTIPTDVDVVPETLTLMERWGADAIRDCDGTDYPEELRAVEPRSIRPITPQEKTIHGQRHIRRRYSRCIL